MWFSLLLQVTETAESLAPSGYGWALFQMLLSLAVVSVLAYLFLRFGLRRLIRPAGGGGLLRVVERHSLDSTKSVWIVEAIGRCFLLGGSEGGVSMLAELDQSAVKGQPAFSDVLAGKKGRGAK